jgi:3-hydroxyacyl-[acyl-carrier-protein] dehydratase
MRLGRDEILRRIPHRPPFLLLEAVEDLRQHVSGTGITTLRAGDPCFAGHFPGDPILPGVLLIECMAQVAAVVFSPPRQDGLPPSRKYFARVEQVTFKQPVHPGARLRTEVHLIKRFGYLIKVKGQVRNHDTLVAEGSIILYDADSEPMLAGDHERSTGT